MRGKSSIAKLRLRSGGYKCNLCGRRVIDVATLERHHKTVHNIPSKGKKIVLKEKTREEKKSNSKTNEKAFDDLLRGEVLADTKPTQKKNNNVRGRVRGEILAECTKKQLTEPEPAQNGDVSQSENVENDLNKSKRGRKPKNDQRKVEFECPVCSKMFNVYYTAHRHIQKTHPVNAQGEKVPINSLSLIQPIRIEQCVKCRCKIKSIEHHTCQSTADDSVGIASHYICSACNQSFISIKMFDLHVGGLHSNGVDSMFFPTEIEFTNWRLEMERDTNVKYSVLGEYDSKKIYRCNYARENSLNDQSTSYFCPSSLMLQELPKGIQVHFYPEHHDHPASGYTLADKYKRYSISTFLKNPDDAGVGTKRLDDKDLYSQFKQLMQSVIVDARFLDIPRLRVLIEKALDMTTVLTSEARPEHASPKQSKTLSDREITEALECKNAVRKRRMSVDAYVQRSGATSPAKRPRNKSVFAQNGDRSSPKIVNTFSLADGGPLTTDPIELMDDSNAEAVANETLEARTTDDEVTSPAPAQSKTRYTDSPSFNDSYKDFIDKTIKASFVADSIRRRGPRGKERSARPLPAVNAKTEPPKPASPSSAAEVDFGPQVTGNGASAKIAEVTRIHNTTITRIETDNTPKTAISKKPNGEEAAACAPPCVLKPKVEIEYEVRERENDCNILILKI